MSTHISWRCRKFGMAKDILGNYQLKNNNINIKQWNIYQAKGITRVKEGCFIIRRI